MLSLLPLPLSFHFCLCSFLNPRNSSKAKILDLGTYLIMVITNSLTPKREDFGVLVGLTCFSGGVEGVSVVSNRV